MPDLTVILPGTLCFLLGGIRISGPQAWCDQELDTTLSVCLR